MKADAHRQDAAGFLLKHPIAGRRSDPVPLPSAPAMTDSAERYLEANQQRFIGELIDLLRIPSGTPIDLLMNVHPKDIKDVLQAYVDGILAGQPHEKFAELRARNHDAGIQQMLKKLLEVNQCPDFIEDRGHTYGRELSDDDKRALIEFMKTF